MSFREPTCHGRRTSRIVLRTTKRLSDSIDNKWKDLFYYDNKGKRKQFKSKGQFMEFVFAIIISKEENSWEELIPKRLTSSLI